MTFMRVLLAATAALGIAGAAGATTYDAVADFSTSSSTGIFSYGTGVTGTDFTPYTNFNLNCLGAGTACWQTAMPILEVPAVVKNTTGATLNPGTVVLPTDVLLVHPGQSTDSIVRFTVPVTGTYHVSGFFEILDTNPTGVNAIIAVDDLSIVASVPLQFPAATHPGTPGASFPFSGTFFAPAGTFIDYGVNNAGNFLNDSVGLSLTFTTVPEPASWALMLVGFGAGGVALRASRRKTVVAA
jgi:PEP-CTERM motif